MNRQISDIHHCDFPGLFSSPSEISTPQLDAEQAAANRGVEIALSDSLMSDVSTVANCLPIGLLSQPVEMLRQKNLTEVSPDVELERQIDQQAMLLYTAKTPEGRRAAMSELARLHPLRSPKRVEQMEREIFR